MLFFRHITQKMKFSIKDFFSKCQQIPRKLRVWSHLLNKSFIENFIFCAVTYTNFKLFYESDPFKIHVYSLFIKFPYSKFFWSLFSRIRTEYGKIRARKIPHTDLLRSDKLRTCWFQRNIFQFWETGNIVFLLGLILKASPGINQTTGIGKC